MEISEVEKILKFYRWIDLEIKITKDWLEQYEDGYNPLSTMIPDGMPHGNKLSNRTALLAIALAETDTKECIEILKNRMEELKQIKMQIFKEISSMQTVHKIILCGLYLQGKKWEQIAKEVSYSVRQAKNIRKEALKILGKKMAKNQVIANSKMIQEFF